LKFSNDELEVSPQNKNKCYQSSDHRTLKFTWFFAHLLLSQSQCKK